MSGRDGKFIDHSVRRHATGCPLAYLLSGARYPAHAAHYFVMLADGCHDADDLPAHWRSPDALRQSSLS
jgi:hypothetical protein